jgi:putative ABC transport system permease protein
MGDWTRAWLTDVRLAARRFRRAPAFTVVAVATLTIGLGGSAAIWALVDHVVLDPLPYPEAERLLHLENRVPGVGPDERWSLSTAQWVFFSDRSRTLEEVGLYRETGTNVMTATGPVRARMVMVTESMLDLLGARALHGRVLQPADDAPGAPARVVVSHEFWTRALGGDVGVVGTSLSLNGETAEVVGVLEPGLTLPGQPVSLSPEIWLPLRIDPDGFFGNNHVFPALGRMAAGAAPAAVDAELARLTPDLPSRFPDAYSAAFFERYGFRTSAVPLKEQVLGDLDRNLWMLFGGVVIVLLIAVANVANLFAVRIEGRRTDVAIRTALGAGRGAVARSMFAESMLLAFLSGALAAVVARWLVPALVAVVPDGLSRLDTATLDASSVLVTFALSALVGLALASFPALSHLRARGVVGLGEAGRRGSRGLEGRRFRSFMVAGQMTLAFALLVGAGLLVRSVRALHATDIGMDPAGTLAVDLHLPSDRYPDDVDLWAFHRAVLEQVRALPGVTAAGMGEEVPVAGGYGCTVQGFEDTAVYDRMTEAGMTTCAGQVRVTPAYFEALGIPIEEGRGLEAGDFEDPSRAAVVVSRAFADRFWRGESAIGKGVGPSGRTRPPFFRVVGVAGDVPARARGGAPLSETAMAVYYPVVDNPEVEGNWYWWPGSMTLVVRAGNGDPTSLLPAVRGVVAGIDPEVPLANPRTMDAVVAEAAATVAFLSLLLAIAAAVAVLLAAVGLFGVVSYLVTQRTREIGMRLAIGARPGEVVWMVVRGTLGLAATGLLVGAPLAWVGAGLMRTVLYDVAPLDPWVYLGAALTLLTAALAAAWLPARRASSIDPVLALRSD